jgi:hypothetical protein
LRSEARIFGSGSATEFPPEWSARATIKNWQHWSSKRGESMPEQEELKMHNRLAFEIVCPHNHNQTIKFTQDEFEALLKSGTLLFHCNTCDTNWPPSTEEIAAFRKQFAKSSS